MLGTDNYFKLAAEHFKAAEKHLIDTEESLLSYKARLEKSVERLGKLRRNDAIYAELREILRSNREAGIREPRPVEA